MSFVWLSIRFTWNSLSAIRLLEVTEQLTRNSVSLTSRATHLCKYNSVADLLKYVPPHMCYHAEFGRSALKGMGINTGWHPKIGDTWNSALLGWATIHALPRICVTTSNLVVLICLHTNHNVCCELPWISYLSGSSRFFYFLNW